jgi:hypothetical protein
MISERTFIRSERERTRGRFFPVGFPPPPNSKTLGRMCVYDVHSFDIPNFPF